MSTLTPDDDQVRAFATPAALARWMRANHARQPELWLRIYKTHSGIASVTLGEALDIALCWGWIDGLRRGYDEQSYLQRYTPRRPKGRWSQVNRDHVARLTAAGRMTPHGQAAIDAAHADGRWAAAYAPMRSASVDSIPADLRAAIAANPRALASLATLSKQNLFALAFRTNTMKTAAGRARKITTLVEMLARGDTIIAQRQP